MEREKISTFAAKFKKAFSEGVLNELGKATRYCHRVRQLTPYRMVITLMALFAGTRVESLADLERGFNALFGNAMDYKPFYDQLAKREFAGFMRETACRLLETLVIRVLGVASGGAFSEFAGSSYRMSVPSRPIACDWQVELLFKEWKSYANLHAFDTQNPAIALMGATAHLGMQAKVLLADTAYGVSDGSRVGMVCKLSTFWPARGPSTMR